MRMIGILCLLLLAAPANAELNADSTGYQSAKHGIKLPIPEGWMASTHTGYPSLLLRLIAPKSIATIIIAIGSLSAGKTIKAYSEENIRGMKAVGITIRSSRSVAAINDRTTWEVLATQPKGMNLRQLYLASGTRIVILTLCAPRDQSSRFAFDLQRLAESLELTEPEHE